MCTRGQPLIHDEDLCRRPVLNGHQPSHKTVPSREVKDAPALQAAKRTTRECPTLIELFAGKAVRRAELGADLPKECG